VTGLEPDLEVREVAVDGRRARWRVGGEGEPLVLLHGLSGSWRWWRPLLGRLAERHRVHLVELPRFGSVGGFAPGDAADWVARALDEVAPSPLRLAGHSLGGLLAAEVAARRPAQTSRLALVAPTGLPSGRGLLGHGLPLLATLRSAPAALLAAVVRDAAAAGPVSLLRGARYAVSTDLRPELRTITAPTLLLWGERDPLVPLGLASSWRRELRHARVVVVPGAGHVPMFDAPAEVAHALLSFLEDEAGDPVGR
jgi:pimeloyl-ACP methyl ester carboxylesterase